MPALNSFTRLLQVLPAGSPACTHIYRLCSSSASGSNAATPPQQAPPPSATASGATSSASPRTSPASLDLGLNFAAMDFDAVAKATHAAIARERGLGAAASLTSQREQELEAKLDRQSEQSLSRLSSPPPTSSPAPQLSSNTSFGAAAGFAQDSRPVKAAAGRGFTRQGAAAPRQPRGERTGSLNATQNSTGSNTRYSLHDMLKDCQMEGNWMKAYQMFNNAVDQACRQVLLPGASSNHGMAPPEASHGLSTTGDQVDPARQAECFAVLKKMLAALPPTSARDAPASSARRVNVKNLRGITRWNGQHYYLLWKRLLEAGKVGEVHHVWSVMQQIGFADFQMEEKTVNTLMALLRRTSRVAEQAETALVSSAFAQTDSFTDQIEREKETRRQLVKDLEQVATTRQFHLVGSNRRTAEGIRIAEALRRVEESAGEEEEGDEKATLGGAAVRDSEDAGAVTSARTLPTATETEDSVIAVGDFNGLLRRSRSTAATQRVLQMMAKLNLEMESTTFASLIASLHNPQYVLDGHTAEELAAFQHIAAAANTTPTAPAAPEGEETTADSANASVDTKTQYEAYKQERVETALQWFFQCPKPRRTADVYNELLYLLRAKSHWKDFDRALVEMRGNAVVSEQEWPESTPVRRAPSSEPAATAAATTTMQESVPATEVSETAATEADSISAEPVAVSAASVKEFPVVLPPQWTTPPNGKTYELLIQRARYVHQWDVMWALYEEMTASRVRGTTRLYEVLLTEAHRHPPQVLNGVEVRSGSAQQSSDVLLRLYDELRRNGGDVRSFKSTLNVVNAWSKSRAKMNRWE